MEICKISRIIIFIIFFTFSSSVRSEIKLLDIKVSAVDLILLKYEIFLTKNFNRLYKGGGIPQTMIIYQYIDSTVKYNENATTRSADTLRTGVINSLEIFNNANL